MKQQFFRTVPILPRQQQFNSICFWLRNCILQTTIGMSFCDIENKTKQPKPKHINERREYFLFKKKTTHSALKCVIIFQISSTLPLLLNVTASLYLYQVWRGSGSIHYTFQGSLTSKIKN